MEAKAQARYVRVTPMKARRVVDLIRGKQATEALAVLKFAPQAASEPVRKVLRARSPTPGSRPTSAAEAFDERDLVISEAFVDEGPTMKRFRPRAQGRAYQILKRTSHITVVVTLAGEQGRNPLMGQKVNPHGFRLGITTDHRSALVRRQHQGGPALPRLREGRRRDPQAHVHGHGARRHRQGRDRAHA